MLIEKKKESRYWSYQTETLKCYAYYVQKYKRQSWKEGHNCYEPSAILKLNDVKKLTIKDNVW